MSGQNGQFAFGVWADKMAILLLVCERTKSSNLSDVFNYPAQGDLPNKEMTCLVLLVIYSGGVYNRVFRLLVCQVTLGSGNSSITKG